MVCVKLLNVTVAPEAEAAELKVVPICVAPAKVFDEALYHNLKLLTSPVV